MKETRPVAIYCRTSKEDPDLRKVSIPQQEEDARRLASANKLPVKQSYIFKDEDRSGKMPPTIWSASQRAESRTELSKVIELIEAEKISAVIVRKLDRLSRDVKLSNRLINLLEEHKIPLLTTHESLPVRKDGASKFTFNTLVNVSEFLLDQISENIKAGKTYQRRRGMKMGGVPLFGYCPIPPCRQGERGDERTCYRPWPYRTNLGLTTETEKPIARLFYPVSRFC